MALAEIPFGPESCAMAAVAISASADKATIARMKIFPILWLELMLRPGQSEDCAELLILPNCHIQ
jgi:hypothetical protein